MTSPWDAKWRLSRGSYPMHFSWQMGESQPEFLELTDSTSDFREKFDKPLPPLPEEATELIGDEDPVNWSPTRKYGAIAVISFLNIINPLTTSMISPSLPELARDFHSISPTLLTFSVSVEVLGLAGGAILICPLSELFGRVPVYHGGNAFFIVFTIACAVATSLPMFTGFRFLQGLAASIVPVLGGPTIGDLIPRDRRGPILAVYGLGALLGPVFGPVAGGAIAQQLHWRWVFYIVAIIAGALSFAGIFVIQETYAPILRYRKQKRIGRVDPNSPYSINKQTLLRHLNRSVLRPLKLLFLSPIILLLSIYVAIAHGYLYLLFTTLPTVFATQYHFSETQSGLIFIGLGVGMIIAMLSVGAGTRRIVDIPSRAGRDVPPEARLKLMLPGTVFTPAGFFLYGWTVHADTHWIWPILGTTFIGFGLLSAFLPVIQYLVDAFPIHAASAVAANTVLRSLVGAVFPLVGPHMFAKLGQGWGASLLAFVSLAMVPVPLGFIRWGGWMRERFVVRL